MFLLLYTYKYCLYCSTYFCFVTQGAMVHHIHIGVIYAGDAGEMSPPLFEMANFVPTTPTSRSVTECLVFLSEKKCRHHFSKQSDTLAYTWFCSVHNFVVTGLLGSLYFMVQERNCY